MNEVRLPLDLDHSVCLPGDLEQATLVGRVWSAAAGGPCVVLVEKGQIYDITAAVPTVSHLINKPNPLAWLRKLVSESDLACESSLGSASEWLQKSDAAGTGDDRLLAPCDLQSIKACGVTFVDSMLERVVEEKALGEPKQAGEIRSSLMARIGGDLSKVVPGSEQSRELKTYLLEQGMWSQYLEVGLGPDAEVFTKSQPMSAVGCGEDIGLHPASKWNNPEPEVVLAVNCRGEIIGCALGNDVNLRDIEGRSALLLGRAKDNNRSCAIGPFIRLLDDHFTLEQAKTLEVNLAVRGPDGFELNAASDLGRISRDIEDLVSQVIGKHHQYPDGFMLFTGTLYAPVEDRAAPGAGFTHELGDVVTIQSPRLGALVNRVGLSTELPPWQFGTGELFGNLARRGFFED